MMQRAQYAALALVVVALFVVTRNDMRNMRMLATDQSFYTTQLAEVTRLEKETLQFRVSVHDYVNGIGDESKEQVRQFFDVLVARLNARWTNSASPGIEALRNYRVEMAGFAADLKSIDAEVSALMPGDQKRLGRIEAVMQRHSLPMRKLNSDSYTELIGRAADLAVMQKRVTRSLDRFQWVFLVVSFTGIVMLLWQLRRGERLYQDLQKREAEIRELAALDALTGLNNRRHFDERMRAIDEGCWQGDCQLLLIDLDGFKQVNDVHGHETGDFVLKEAAARIRRIAPANAVPARLGGDEFAIVFAGPLDRAQIIAGQIVSELKEPFVLASGSVRIGASIGIASRRSPAKASVTMLREADMALYAAKAGGRNRYTVFKAKPAPERMSAA